MDHHATFSGRVTEAPSAVLDREILRPQFEYELQHLLPFYLAIEKASLNASVALGIMAADQARMISAALDQISAASLQADPTRNFSDISFAIERTVADLLPAEVPSWHVDKSRNDFQACAQRMFARQRIFQTVRLLDRLSATIVALAERSADLPMPGYTHYQAAQVITPGFYLAAINETLLSTLRRLLTAYADLNQSPLGAGAMAGLELPWDRQQMARELGFDAPVRSALASVSDRDWTLKISFEFALFGTAISRFCTDLSMWGSSEYGFIDLPDALAGISSAMPQKKNFTILERIRGETSHLASLHLDFLLGQRNTPYTNLVEVSKEAGRYLLALFSHIDRIATLLNLVMEQLSFRADRMREACEREYYGGFALANALTLRSGIPYRTAQIIAGEFIRAAVAAQIRPSDLRLAELQSIAGKRGYDLDLSQEQLHELFDVTANLVGKQSGGSTQPQQVRTMLAEQRRERDQILQTWSNLEQQVMTALGRFSPTHDSSTSQG
jgi:argininosuccinate lyase